MDDLYRGLGPPPTCCLMCRSAWDEKAGAAGVSFSVICMKGMTLCPDCGNKRCPKATNHELACTGSNESGQPGSHYRMIDRLRRRVCITCEAPSTSILCRPCAHREFQTREGRGCERT